MPKRDGRDPFFDFTQPERDRMARVIAAALSEAGYPCWARPSPDREGNWHLVHEGGDPPREAVDRALELALIAVGKSTPDRTGLLSREEHRG